MANRTRKPPQTSKVCSRCEAEKPANAFGVRSDKGQRRLRSHCFECENERSREWVASNPDKRRSAQRKSNAKSDPDARRAWGRVWREKNRETLNQRMRDWRAANPDRAYTVAKRWRDANQDKLRDNEYRREFGITLAEYESMLAEQGGGCAVCKKSNVGGKRLAVDHCHTTQVVRGLLCNGCNRSIGFADDNPETLRRLAAYLERYAAGRAA